MLVADLLQGLPLSSLNSKEDAKKARFTVWSDEEPVDF
jgi:hypothetical protein